MASIKKVTTKTRIGSKKANPPKKKPTTSKVSDEVEEVIPPNPYTGLIAVKRSPVFKDWKGDPLNVRDWDGSGNRPAFDEVVAVDPKDKRVEEMLKNGNLQFVADKIREGTGDKPKIIG